MDVRSIRVCVDIQVVLLLLTRVPSVGNTPA